LLCFQHVGVHDRECLFDRCNAAVGLHALVQRNRLQPI
jgi:hypothetical protein